MTVCGTHTARRTPNTDERGNTRCFFNHFIFFRHLRTENFRYTRTHIRWLGEKQTKTGCQWLCIRSKWLKSFRLFWPLKKNNNIICTLRMLGQIERRKNVNKKQTNRLRTFKFFSLFYLSSERKKRVQSCARDMLHAAYFLRHLWIKINRYVFCNAFQIHIQIHFGDSIDLELRRRP